MGKQCSFSFKFPIVLLITNAVPQPRWSRPSTILVFWRGLFIVLVVFGKRLCGSEFAFVSKQSDVLSIDAHRRILAIICILLAKLSVTGLLWFPVTSLLIHNLHLLLKCMRFVDHPAIQKVCIDLRTMPGNVLRSTFKKMLSRSSQCMKLEEEYLTKMKQFCKKSHFAILLWKYPINFETYFVVITSIVDFFETVLWLCSWLLYCLGKSMGTTSDLLAVSFQRLLCLGYYLRFCSKSQWTLEEWNKTEARNLKISIKCIYLFFLLLVKLLLLFCPFSL